MLVHRTHLDCPRCGRRFTVLSEVFDADTDTDDPSPPPAYAPPSAFLRCPRCGWTDTPADALAIARHLNRKPLPQGRVLVHKGKLRPPLPERKPLFTLHDPAPTAEEVTSLLAAHGGYDRSPPSYEPHRTTTAARLTSPRKMRPAVPFDPNRPVKSLFTGTAEPEPEE